MQYYYDYAVVFDNGEAKRNAKGDVLFFNGGPHVNPVLELPVRERIPSYADFLDSETKICRTKIYKMRCIAWSGRNHPLAPVSTTRYYAYVESSYPQDWLLTSFHKIVWTLTCAFTGSE